MTGRGKGAWLAAALAVAFGGGMLHFLGVEFEAGDVYPELSSLRADPQGARLLFESLARLPSLTVSRNYLPPELFEADGATVLFLGLDPREFGKDMDDLRQLRQLAERGNRVVAAMRAPAGKADIPATKLNREWDLRLAADSRGVYFSKAEGWEVIDRAGHRAVTVQRAFGRGSIVMLADGAVFDNESAIAGDRLGAVTAALGGSSRIVFDESHFGIRQSGSVVGLARRFRLTGMALGLIGCALLWIWRNASAFPPPARTAPVERMAGRTSAAGLVTLLRRYIAPSGIADACWEEWVAANRRAAPAAAVEVLRSNAGPVEKMRELHRLVARAPKGVL